MDSQQLAGNIAGKFAGGNPIICGQNLPSAVRVDREVEQPGNMAAAYVVEDFADGNQKQILIDLEVIGSTWKIVNISCPRP